MMVARGTSDDKVLARLKMSRQRKMIKVSVTLSRTASSLARAELVSFTLATRDFRSLYILWTASRISFLVISALPSLSNTANAACYQ